MALQQTAAAELWRAAGALRAWRAGMAQPAHTLRRTLATKKPADEDAGAAQPAATAKTAAKQPPAGAATAAAAKSKTVSASSKKKETPAPKKATASTATATPTQGKKASATAAAGASTNSSSSRSSTVSLRDLFGDGTAAKPRPGAPAGGSAADSSAAPAASAPADADLEDILQAPTGVGSKSTGKAAGDAVKTNFASKLASGPRLNIFSAALPAAAREQTAADATLDDMAAFLDGSSAPRRTPATNSSAELEQSIKAHTDFSAQAKKLPKGELEGYFLELCTSQLARNPSMTVKQKQALVENIASFLANPDPKSVFPEAPQEK